MKPRTREAWVIEAVALVRPTLATLAGIEVPDVRISFGDMGKRTAARCYAKSCTADAVHEVAISLRHRPEPIEVLGSLAHELIHASGLLNHHRNFQRAAKDIGLVTAGKWLDAGLDGVSVDDAPAWARSIGRRLGAWPAPALNPADRPKRQTTRMVRVSCEACAVVWRAARVHLADGVTCPIIGCDGPAVIHWPAEVDE